MNTDNENEVKAEKWKRVPEWNDYEISTLGKIRSWKNKAGYPSLEPKIKRPSLSYDGYHKIQLRNKGLIGTFSVARLMLKTFKQKQYFKDAQASHLNGNKIDNRIENLCWESRFDNNRRKYSHGTMSFGTKCHFSRLNEKQVLSIRESYKNGIKTHNLARKYKVNPETIRNILRKNSWNHI